jgi:hypothetical protein
LNILAPNDLVPSVEHPLLKPGATTRDLGPLRAEAHAHKFSLCISLVPEWEFPRALLEEWEILSAPNPITKIALACGASPVIFK